MKKRVLNIIGVCLILAGIFANIDLNSVIGQNSDLLLKNIIAIAKADGEGSSECTETCFNSKCEAAWEDVNCGVTCGSTSCSFGFAKKK